MNNQTPLSAHLSDVQDRAARLRGLLDAISHLDHRNECRSGRSVMIELARDMAQSVQNDLDSVNLPEAGQ